MFIAEIIFWGQAKGGRYKSPQPGYKPLILLGNIKTSCIVNPIDESVVKFEFDEKYLVRLNLMFPDEYSSKLSINDEVALFEGNKQVATGKIVALE